MSEYFEMAAAIVRAQAAAVQAVLDSPTRTAPPEGIAREFDELEMHEQLDLAHILCQRAIYRDSVAEAFGESERYGTFREWLLNPAVDDAQVGKLARQMVIDYLLSVLAHRGDELPEGI